jgi:hypothetical protein
MKIRLVRAELFHADRRTDRRTGRRDETNSRISQFCQLASKSRTSILSARSKIRDTINRTAADLRLKPPGHSDRPQNIHVH